MMREIKFRGRKNGRWIYGFYVTSPNGMCPQIITCENDPRAHMYRIHCVHSVDEGSVGQYTGYKDHDGKEIYEDDIVSFTVWWFDGNEAESQLTGTIVYSPELMSFQLKGVKNKEWERHTGYEGDDQYLTPFSELNFDEADFKILGNRRENPELMESK